MFTGIIEETGKIKSLNSNSVTILADKVLKDVKIGDSIAVNGICLTVTSFDNTSFSADVSNETIKVTNFNYLKTGSLVNLERAMKLEDRFGGHIVSGHIDCTATVLYNKNLNDFNELTIKLNENFSKYIVKKGSICINGVSLTVNSIEDNVLSVMLIPQTLSNTNLLSLNVNDTVNIETDILAKYTEKLLKTNGEKSSNITEELLVQNGFM
ncbi:riboflavin synthase [bacterium]|nr:riboflavin synthase [bacterium]